MKTFKDLKFKTKFETSISALEVFENGFEISVVAGKHAYSTPREDNLDHNFFSSFEVAVFAPNGDFVTKDFVPNHDDDVLGWQSRGQINALMLLIQSKK